MTPRRAEDLSYRSCIAATSKSWNCSDLRSNAKDIFCRFNACGLHRAGPFGFERANLKISKYLSSRGPIEDVCVRRQFRFLVVWSELITVPSRLPAIDAIEMMSANLPNAICRGAVVVGESATRPVARRGVLGCLAGNLTFGSRLRRGLCRQGARNNRESKGESGSAHSRT